MVFVEPAPCSTHVYSLVHIPRIGSLLLASILRDRGYSVSVVVEDMLHPAARAGFWRHIRQADVLMISAITMTAGRCYELADSARAVGMRVVIGGIHPSYLPDEAIQHADWVLRGECDESLLRFMEALEAGDGFDEVPGLTWHAGDGVRHNPDAPLPPSAVLESNPFPDYGLLWGTQVAGGVASFAAARGCPFGCSFCSVTKFNGPAVRAMSAERTLDMIEEHWLRFKPHYIFFAEDIFNLQAARAKKIMRGLIDRRIRPRVGFGAQMRHEVARDDEFMGLMHEAGFDRAMIGFESINGQSLDACGKRQTPEEISYTIRRLHQHGVKVHGMFVGGFDTDTPQTFFDTLQFVKRHHLDSFQFMLLTPLPGSQDWYDGGYASGERPLLTADWSKFDGHHAVVRPRQMSAYEANVLAMDIMRRFYSPSRALGRLLRGDWLDAVFRWQAWWLINHWRRQPDNIEYLDMLRRL